MARLALRWLVLLLPLNLAPAWAADKPRAAGPASPAGAPQAAAGQDELDPDNDPPPGSARDLALWREGRELSHLAVTTLATGRKLQQKAKAGAVLDKLEAAARQAPPEEAERLRALRTRVNERWKDAYLVLDRRWPVDPIRACGYPLLNFESALRAAADGTTRADLSRSRDELKQCIGRASMAVKALDGVNVPFKAALDEAEKVLVAAAAPAKGAAAQEQHRRHEASEKASGARRD